MARRAICAAFWWDSLGNTFENICREFIAKAQKAERAEKGHDCGHQFEITIRSTGHSSGVRGEVPPVHSDANYSDALVPVTVRAHNLRDALLVAASVPLSDWFDEECQS